MSALLPVGGGEPHQLVPEAALQRLHTIAASLRLAGSIVAGRTTALPPSRAIPRSSAC